MASELKGAKFGGMAIDEYVRHPKKKGHFRHSEQPVCRCAVPSLPCGTGGLSRVNVFVTTRIAQGLLLSARRVSGWVAIHLLKKGLRGADL